MSHFAKSRVYDSQLAGLSNFIEDALSRTDPLQAVPEKATQRTTTVRPATPARPSTPGQAPAMKRTAMRATK